MVNLCVSLGLENDVSSLKRLSLLSYRKLARYHCPACYKLCAISRAAGIIASRKKSIRRGIRSKSPLTLKPQLVAYRGFKFENGTLKISLGHREYFDVPLNAHTLQTLSDHPLRVRSLTLTASAVSLTISKEVQEIECTKAAGLDRNLRNLTYGNDDRVIRFDLSKTISISEMTRQIISCFKRADARIRKRIAIKYGARKRSRVSQLLHRSTKEIVKEATLRNEAIILEDLRGIRQMYRRGNGMGREHRAIMNAWSFAEVQRQVEYKARWNGVPVVRLTRKLTGGTSRACPRCGERLQSDREHYRELWCPQCGKWIDRDVVAAINLSRKGRLRFDRSEGGAVEAMRRNPTPTVILGVDASKPGYAETGQNQSLLKSTTAG